MWFHYLHSTRINWDICFMKRSTLVSDAILITSTLMTRKCLFQMRQKVLIHTKHKVSTLDAKQIPPQQRRQLRKKQSCLRVELSTTSSIKTVNKICANMTHLQSTRHSSQYTLSKTLQRLADSSSFQCSIQMARCLLSLHCLHRNRAYCEHSTF